MSNARRHLDVWLDRIGLRSALARDCAFAVVLSLLTAGLFILLTGSFAADRGVLITPRQRVLAGVILVAQALALSIRRTHPAACVVVVATAQALLAVTLASQATVRGAATMVACYTAGTCLPIRRLLRWGGLAVVIEAASPPLLGGWIEGPLRAWSKAEAPGVDLSAGAWVVSGLSILLLYGVAGAVGVAAATRRENVALLQARSLTAERARATEARRAVEDERLRMARELHDVAAHHLTGLLVQASAAERLLGRDSNAARVAIHEVRDQGKQALDNLRSVVGMLRHDDAARGLSTGAAGRAAAQLAPVPGLAVLPDLIEAARGLGDHIELVVTGAPFALAPVADVTAYRVTQESLSNARQHAPRQPVEISLAYTERAVELSVTNPAADRPKPAKREGFGLAGMHERAALAGATLAAGPSDDRRWQVALTIPRPGRGAALDDHSAGAR